VRQVFEVQEMSELEGTEVQSMRLIREIPAAREAQPATRSPDLKAFMNILKRRRLVVFGCAASLTLLALIIVLNLTPVYTAEAVVMLNTRKSQVVDLQAVLSGLQSDEAAIRTEVEVVKSRALAQRVVDELDLTSNQLLNPRLAPPTFWQQINPITKIRSAIQQLHPSGKAVDAQESVPDQQREDNDAVVSRVMSTLDIFNDGRSYVLKVRFQAADPRLAAKIANAFANDYLQSQLDAKYEATQRAIDWLNTHLTDLHKKVEKSDRAVQQYMAEHGLVGSRDQTVITQQLSELNSQLTLATADLTQKESNVRQAQALVRSGQAESVAPAITSPLIQSLKAQDSALLQKQAELSTRYDRGHPKMVDILAQRKQVETKIQDEVTNIIRGMDNDVGAARARAAALTTAIQNLQKEANTQDTAGVGLRDLKREADTDRNLYENLLNRFKETSTQADIQQPDARLVSSAAIPVLPTFPRVGVLTGIAFMLSLITGIVVAFLLEYFDHGFRSAANIEQTLGIPFLGYVPRLSSGTAAHRHIIEEPLSTYAEALRSVRTALRFSKVGNPPKIIMVTSAIPAEGKTIFAASLAQSVERSGGRSILVDCDLRHPTIGKLFDVKKGPGLVSYFEGRSNLADLIHNDANSRLDYITADERTTDPQELLDSQHMRDVLAKLRSAYDCVILDAPPVLAVSDAVVLSHLADATVFIVRWEKTPRHVAMSGLKLLHSQGANLAGVVLSCVDTRRHAKYDYGDAAYYYGRYSRYYDLGVKPKRLSAPATRSIS
jgi:polysaccharide biosynthesis transport protein